MATPTQADQSTGKCLCHYTIRFFASEDAECVYSDTALSMKEFLTAFLEKYPAVWRIESCVCNVK